eukprot:6161389-Prymnesium_polylepis.2
MPAPPALSVPCGASFKDIACASDAMHSAPVTAISPMCIAVSADAQAVSTLAHGPCMPSTKDKRPPATDRLAPVAS